MPYFRSSLAVLSAVAACVPLSAYASETLTLKQRYDAAIDVVATDPEAGVQEMNLVAEEGYARAMDRMAYYYHKGIGVEVDNDRAVRLYQMAISEGREKSLISLGKTYIAIGEADAALEALDRAVSYKVSGALATRAWGHAAGGFGEKSRPDEGWQDLVALARSGDRTAELAATSLAAKGTRTLDAPDPILASLMEKSVGGDGSASEALLRYYRSVGHPEGSLERRAALLEHPNIRDKVAIDEGLYLASEAAPGRFNERAEKLVLTAGTQDFSRALEVTSKIDKNAYVRIVQMELARLGYFSGQADGLLDQSTISSINAFCRDTQITDTCVFGPVKSVAIKAVAAKLAESRDDTADS